MERKIIAEVFAQVAEGLETGNYGNRPRIAVTGMGGEHGEQNVMEGAQLAARQGIDVHYIGTLEGDGVAAVKVQDEAEGHAAMERMLKNREVDGAVTMHYPFPIGVTTVGRVVTPARGRQMFIAATTGASAADRVEAMVRNAICGIAAAKACGVKQPAVGILNVEGARQAEIILKQLQKNGYDMAFAESARSDGGAVMRGNDLLMGGPDVVVMDSLTGNVVMKLLSAFNTGGAYEAAGWGYGPGIGENYHKLILIISRASGAPVIANAIQYAGELARGNAPELAKAEFAKAERAGLGRLLGQRKNAAKPMESENVDIPPSEPVTAGIAGVDVMDIEDGTRALWKQGIYAESGMGCTGPLVMVSEANYDSAVEILRQAGYIG